jgi:phosphatidylinositol alpha-1,6-mannosyltransferase
MSSRVLFLTPGCYDKGGISRYSRYEISAMHAIFGDENVRTLSVLGPDEDSFEDPVPVDWAANGIGARAKAAFVAQTITQAIRWRPQIIHSAHVNLSGLAGVAARLVGATTILNTYGVEVWSGMRWDARQGLASSDVVVSDCHATADYLEQSSLRPKGSTTVIWDCVDLKRFYPKPPDPGVLRRYGIPNPTHHFVLLTLGRLSRAAAYKGYERLLSVFATIAHAYPRLVLVYAGAGELSVDLRHQAAALGLGDRVIFTGSVREEDLPDIYRSASLFSLVSERGPGRGEGLPLTPLEALACGVPIVVGNEDGSREAVQGSVNGFVISPRDLETHASIIRKLLAMDELRARLSEGAVKSARDHFSYSAFEQKHRALYDRCLAGGLTASSRPSDGPGARA